MTDSPFGPADLKQITNHSQQIDDVSAQLELFRNPPAPICLDRPCTAGDGIVTLAEADTSQLLTMHDEAKEAGRLSKFVPASGAASRMFRTLLKVRPSAEPLSRQTIQERSKGGDGQAEDLLRFIDNIRAFAFAKALEDQLSKRGTTIENACLTDIGMLVEALLDDQQLGFAKLPKGMIPFHQYDDGPRTAFEEHLYEALAVTAPTNGKCRVHFTLSLQHQESVESFLQQRLKKSAADLKEAFNITTSTQKLSTDTLAVDLQNNPFRTANRKLLFRPGGHGALLKNLNDFQGDIVFVKNIDNIQPAGRRAAGDLWKRILSGYLVGLQNELFQHVAQLTNETPDLQQLQEAKNFAANRLNLDVDALELADGPKACSDKLLKLLNRPLRVCAMVRNEGEPGGGPFWVRDTTGARSLQIVESAQVAENQKSILQAATHFNPVDLVCGVRDWRGEPFDLEKFVDERAVFIAEKSEGGRDLKALERPGLWNGSMAFWNTIFVEVPAATFSPVKEINDLLRPAHQVP